MKKATAQHTPEPSFQKHAELIAKAQRP